MAKEISSLSVTLGATVAPFVSAFSGIGNVVTGFVESMKGAGESIVAFTGAGLAVNALTSAFHELVSAPAAAIEAAQAQAEAQTNLVSVLAATGGAAGQTADQLIAFAQSLQDTTTFGHTAIEGFQATLATFKNVSGSTFDAATKAALDMSTVLHTDLQTTAVQLGKALNNPIDGISALTRVGVSFTEQQKAQIKAMQDAGNVAGAQTIILNQLQSAFGGAAAAAAATPFGQLKQLSNAFGDTVEQVGSVLGTMEAAVAQAFNLKGGIAELSAGLAWVQSMVPTAVGYLTPIIGSIVETVEWAATTAWGYVESGFDAIYAYVAPIMTDIAGVVAANWQGIVETQAAYLGALYNETTSLASAIWQIISVAWTDIAAVWTWGANLLGVQNEAAATSTGSSVQTMIDVWQGFTQGLTEVINIGAFALTHFTDIIQYVGVTAASYIVELYNQVEYYFGAAVQYVEWFGENFTSLILDAFNVGSTITTNGVKNVAAIISNLPGLIAGTTDLADIWTPLTQGFTASVGALPQIAARVPGDLETALTDQSKQLGTGLVDGLFDSLNNADKRAANAGKGITNAISATLGSLKMPTFDATAAAAFDPKNLLAGAHAMVGGATDATNAVDGLNKSVQNTASSWKALTAGSAEAMQATAQAAFKSTLGMPDASNGAAAMAGSAVANAADSSQWTPRANAVIAPDGGATPSAAVVPVDAGTVASIASKNDQSMSNADMVTLVKQLLAYAKQIATNKAGDDVILNEA